MKLWTTSEHQLLVRLCNEATPISRQLHLFPGRSIVSIYKYMMASGIRKKRLLGRDPYRAREIEAILADREMYAFEIAKEMGVTIPTIRPLLNQLHAQKKIYIAERVLLGPTVRSYRWALGNKPDAPRLHEPARKKVAKVKAHQSRAETAVDVHRDPLQTAFFGNARSVATSVTPTGQVYRQDMSVKDDELEVAA